MAKRSKKLSDVIISRARVLQLRSLPASDWSDWEADWLDKEATRSQDYLYTDKERVSSNQLIASATPFESYNGWSVVELLRIAHRYRADLTKTTKSSSGGFGRANHAASGFGNSIVSQVWRAYQSQSGGTGRLKPFCAKHGGKDDELHHEMPEFVAYS